MTDTTWSFTEAQTAAHAASAAQRAAENFLRQAAGDAGKWAFRRELAEGGGSVPDDAGLPVIGGRRTAA